MGMERLLREQLSMILHNLPPSYKGTERDLNDPQCFNLKLLVMHRQVKG